MNQPTRVTETTSSMIDHIYTTEERLVNGVTVPHSESVISHHKEQNCKADHTSVTYRDVTKINKQAFVRDLTTVHGVMLCQKITWMLLLA